LAKNIEKQDESRPQRQIVALDRLYSKNSITNLKDPFKRERKYTNHLYSVTRISKTTIPKHVISISTSFGSSM
jgi:hypothetical protein